MLKAYFVLATILISTGQKITLFEYRQEDSETKCTQGLVSGVDTVVFKSQMDYSQDTAMKYAQFYIQKKMDQIPLLYDDLNIQECVSSQKITCERVDRFIINVTIKVPASNDYNGAAISGILVTSNWKQILSKIHDFPKIMDSKSTSGWMIVNGNVISTNLTGCDINVNDTILNITYLCDSDIKPCLIEITVAGVEKSSRGEDHAMYIFEQRPPDINLTIKHASCTLAGECNTLQCRIHKEKVETTSNVNVVLIIIASIVATMVIILVLLCSIYRKKIKSAFRKLICKGPTTTHATDETEGGVPFLLQPITDQTINTSTNLEDYTCEKNQGHSEFYALSDFKSDNVHKDYQNDKIISLIKCVADLTARICVKHTSQNRPITDPAGNGMNIKYAIADTTAHRYKTGMVIQVKQHLDDGSTCPCEKCAEKGEHSKSWGKVFILTASTVVYDHSEAEKSSFDLWYDSDTSEFCTLHGRCVSDIDQSEGWCVVECVTCDLSLLDKLIEMTKKCREQMTNVNSEYNNARNKHTFTFIVSHPHGFPKHVSVGFWKNRETVPNDRNIILTKYQYTTRTCPGSAGAFVYIIGVTDISQKAYHVHISYQAERCNYCSTGVDMAPENN